MTTAAIVHRIDDEVRARALLILLAGLALALGAWAALAALEWSLSLAILLGTAAVVFTFPLPWLAVLLTVLVPLQFYFEVPDSPFTLRVTVVLVALTAVRVMMRHLSPRATAAEHARALKDYIDQFAWMIPAALFLFAACVAAAGAGERYLALKGIYDWVMVLATALVIGEIALTSRARDVLVSILVLVGAGEAILGLAEHIAGLDTILQVLGTPLSELFIQPSLLNARLADLSFNWVLDGRAVPFGTFINAIDYAIFLAATLSLTLALLMKNRGKVRNLALAFAALVTGTALVLTFKGSGLIALAGGVASIAFATWLRRRRGMGMSGVLVPLILIAGLTAILLLPFSGSVIERLTYLVQREAGTTGDTGRLEIWASLVQYVVYKPFFGYGLNNSIYITEPARTLRDGVVAFNLTSPESAYIAALVETGIFGFAALLGLLGTVLARAWRNIAAASVAGTAETTADPVKDTGILAALVALLLGNMTVVGLSGEQNGMLLGVLIGLVFSTWKRT